MALYFSTFEGGISSVAGGQGGIAFPIVMQSVQNTLFLVLLRPIFALKAKIVLPLALAIRIGLWT